MEFHSRETCQYSNIPDAALRLDGTVKHMVGPLCRNMVQGLVDEFLQRLGRMCQGLDEGKESAERIPIPAADLCEGIRSWIKEGKVQCPNTMVDRITPGPKPENMSYIANSFGVDDEVPVMSESFLQFFVEDRWAVDSLKPPTAWMALVTIVKEVS